MYKIFSHFSSPIVLFNLQALRAFAALNVVALHTAVISPSYQLPVSIFKFFDGWGASGVDIFFVLSGFIMIFILSKNSPSPGKFFIDRITRIAPLYYFLTLLLFLSTLFFPELFRTTSQIFFSHLLASIFFVNQFFYNSWPILYDGWTLEYEMLFYLLLTIGLCLKNRGISIGFVVLSIIMLSFYRLVDLIAIEFIFGIAAALIFLYLPNRPWLFWVYFSTGIIMLISQIVSDLSFIPGMQYRTVRFGIPAFFLVLGLAGIASIKKGLLTRLGDASYSIYLIQVFTIPAFYKGANILNRYSIIELIPNDLLALGCITVTACVGILVHYYCEVPLTQLARKAYAKY